MRLLVVEDEVKMAGLLKQGLEEEGYAVDVAGTGSEALWLGTENPYEAILLDVMLPDLDGFEVCRQLRTGGRWAPVLMLDYIRDRILGTLGPAEVNRINAQLEELLAAVGDRDFTAAIDAAAQLGDTVSSVSS